MGERGGRGAGKLSLTVDHGVIEAVEGDRSLLPADMSEPVGMSLFELVHPVDRERIAAWLGELPGVSPVFRRAQADEPVRWFELAAVGGAIAGRTRMLLVEVTSRVRELDLMRRVMGILARFGGEELLERIPAVAMEVTGTEGALVADIHGPLAVVRVVAGDVGVPEGAALTVAGSPLEAAMGARGSRVYEDGLGERFPASALVQGAGARSAAVVPIHLPDGEEAVAVLAVLSPGLHRFSDVEREMLETLAARTGLELAGRAAAGGSLGEAGGGWRFASGLALEGAVNAFGNLLAAIGLNCELALSSEDLEPATIPRLDRIAASVARGGKLVHLMGMLSAPLEGTAAPGRVDVVLGELADLLPLCAEGLEMTVTSEEGVEAVWAPETVLYSVLSALVLAAARARPGGLRVTARLMGPATATPGPGMVAVELVMTPRGEAPPRRSWDPVPEAMEAVRRLLALVGGEIELKVEEGTLSVRVGLVAVRADESEPHRRV